MHAERSCREFGSGCGGIQMRRYWCGVLPPPPCNGTCYCRCAACSMLLLVTAASCALTVQLKRPRLASPSASGLSLRHRPSSAGDRWPGLLPLQRAQRGAGELLLQCDGSAAAALLPPPPPPLLLLLLYCCTAASRCHRFCRRQCSEAFLGTCRQLVPTAHCPLPCMPR